MPKNTGYHTKKVASMINIKGMNKANVLQALFNHSKQQGLGVLDESGRKSMSIDDAKSIVEQSLRFDYLRGRVLKVDISGDQFNEWCYDRDNGQGAALQAIESIVNF